MRSFFGELKRRNVIKVAAMYAIVGWLMVEITTTVLPTFEAPDWVTKVITFLIILGFPLALIFAWAFEMTPDGLKRSHEVPIEQSIATTTGKKINALIISALVIAIVVLVTTGRWSPGPDERTATKSGALNSIAVLPFANRSKEEDDVYFVDGMHDDILTQLAKIQALKVISRTSVMEYRDTTKNMQQIGQELGASAILEGGVQRAGSTVRINVQLIDAATDKHLWAETYDRELTVSNVFAIQSEMANEIASALRAALTPEEQQRIATIPTQNLEAYEQYLLGKSKLPLRIIKDLEEAIEHFKHAIELDPGYAKAYVGLANAESLLFNYGNVPVDEYLLRAKPAAERAIELDPGLSEAYTAMGGVYQQLNDVDKSTFYLNKAVALNANDSLAYHWLAETNRDLIGDAEKALKYHRIASELDPRAPVIAVSICEDLFYLGRFDEAVDQAIKVVNTWPEYDGGLWHAGFPYWTVYGQIDKAMQYFDHAMEMLVDSGNYAVHAGVSMDLENDELAREYLDKALELGGDFYTFLNAALFESLQNNDQAAGAAADHVLVHYPHPAALRVLRDIDVNNGDIDSAIARYMASSLNPLFESPIKYDPPRSGEILVDFAYLYSLKGDSEEKMHWLMDAAKAHFAKRPRLGYFGYGIADVRLALLKDDKEKALNLLNQAVDEKWQYQWRFHLSNPALDEIRDEPGFQQAVDKIRASIAEQNTRLAAYLETVADG